MGMNNISTPIQLINAARALAGRKAIRLSYGNTQFFVVQSLYHNVRRNALCSLMPEFAIKTKDCERPRDMLRDLGDGRYVADDEIVWEWSDDFKMKMVVDVVSSLKLILNGKLVIKLINSFIIVAGFILKQAM